MSIKLGYMPKSKSDIHITPKRVYDIILQRWGYTKNEMFDPCPLNPTFNGLLIPWEKINFVNPPYTLLNEFVKKADDEARQSKVTILLLPSKTEQPFFHKYVKPRFLNIEWIEKRLKFENNKHHSPQAHFLVKFGN